MESQLRTLRKSSGLTQKEVASFLGYSEQLISIWERGSSFPDASAWGGLCKLYRIPLSTLLLEESATTGISADIDFDPQDFCTRLLLLRKGRGLTQTELAAKLGINPKTIISFEKGKSLPSRQAFLSLCDYYSLTPEELYFGLKVEKEQAHKDEEKPLKNPPKPLLFPKMLLIPLFSILLLLFFIPSAIPMASAIDIIDPSLASSGVVSYDPMEESQTEISERIDPMEADLRKMASGDEVYLSFIDREGREVEGLAIPYGYKPTFDFCPANIQDESSNTCYVFQGFEDIDKRFYADANIKIKYKAVTLDDYLSSPYEFSFTPDGEGLILNRFKGTTEERWEIPSSILGYPVRVLNFTIINDRNVKELIIPDSVIRIMRPILPGSETLRSITLSENLEKVDNYIVPSCTGLTYTNAESCQYLGSKSNPYLYCSSAESFGEPISFSKRCRIVNYIQYYSTPPKVILSESVSYLSEACLRNLQLCTSFEVEEGNPFFRLEEGCLIDGRDDSLIAVNQGVSSLPEGIKRIRRNALNNYSGENLLLPSGLETIEGSLSEFENTARRIGIGQNLSCIHPGAFKNFPQIENYDVNEANAIFESHEGSLYSKGKERLFLFPSASKQTVFEAPKETESFGSYCFNAAQNLEQVKALPNNAVRASSLTYYSFSSCPNLKLVELNVSRIRTSAFYNCPNLNRIVLGKSLVGIESYAFEGCLELNSVYYQGKQEEWDNLAIQENSFFPNTPKMFFLG